MDSTELRHRIKIKRRTGQACVDTNGITREVLEDITSLWAAIEMIEKKNYYFQIDEVRLDVNTRIKIRYNPNLEPLLIAELRTGKMYDICKINDIDELHREMHLMSAEFIKLDKICIVHRRNVAQTPSYPCTFLRKNNIYKQEAPNATTTEDFFLYGEPVMDVKPGDLVEVDEIKYVASTPYRPKNHHTEVNLMRKGDVGL
jgi:SPP1 family predicted phage head-tail adaptor